MQERHGFALISAPLFWLERANESAAISEKHYHYHDCYQLYYLYSGELYYFINNKTYLVKPGNIVLVNSYDIHCTFASSQKHSERLIIDFKREYIEQLLCALGEVDLFGSFEGGIHLLKLNMQEQNRIEALLQNMTREYFDSQSGRNICLKAQLIELLTLINRHTVGESATDDYASYAHKTVSEVTAYINGNISKELTLTELAARYYVSPFYLSRIFKRITGMPFAEYVNGVRIKDAQRLLIKTKLSVSQISEEVGYKSCTHFGRVFKAITGKSPSAYRRALSGESDLRRISGVP